MDSKVEIQIPEKLISNLIQAELIDKLGDKEKLIRAVVQSAMSFKPDRYSDETNFEKKIKEMIQDAAKEAFQEWLTKHKEKIKQALINYMTKNKNKVLKNMVDALIKEGSSWRPFVRIDLKKDEI